MKRHSRTRLARPWTPWPHNVSRILPTLPISTASINCLTAFTSYSRFRSRSTCGEFKTCTSTASSKPDSKPIGAVNGAQPSTISATVFRWAFGNWNQPMLRKLASSYGVQTSYIDVDQKRVECNPTSILAVLQSLGAPLERIGDAGDALRARRLALTQSVLPPVIALWDDGPPGFDGVPDDASSRARLQKSRGNASSGKRRRTRLVAERTNRASNTASRRHEVHHHAPATAVSSLTDITVCPCRSVARAVARAVARTTSR